MAFDLTEWQAQVAARWREWAPNTKRAMASLGVTSAYGLLAAGAWLPLVAAYTQDPGDGVKALVGITGGIGANLVANLVQRGFDATTAARDLESLAAGDPQTRVELDAVLAQVETVQAAQAALGQRWEEFLERLAADLRRIDSPRLVQTIIDTGGAAYIGAGVNTWGGDFAGHNLTKQSVEQGVAIAGPMYGDVYLGGAKPTQPPDGLRAAYLNWVLCQARAVPLAGIDPKAVRDDACTDLDLAAVYTALMTRSMWIETGAFKPPREEGRRSAVAELNDHKYLALLGDPGSGKSTFVNFVALCLAGEALGHGVANLQVLTAPLPVEEEGRGRSGEEERPAPQRWDHGALLPLRVVLRDFAVRGLPAAAGVAPPDALWSFIVAELPETLRDVAGPVRLELLGRGGLLLLDGLDEVPEADQRRGQVKAAVQSFKAAFPQARVLVTSRTYAYQKQAWKLPGFAEAVVAPFDPRQVHLFVDRWYAYIGPVRHLAAEDAKGRSVLLNNAIARNPRLSELAARPLLLTLMASLHAWRGGTLPEQREELYADAVDLLLDQWEGQKVKRRGDGQPELIQPSLAEWLKVDRKAVRVLLNRLAYEAHREQPDLVGTADIAQDRLVAELLRLNPSLDARPGRLVEHLSVRAGLLEPRGVGVYAFPHRTFQEYLAACHLTDFGFPDELADLLRTDPNRWREVVLLAGAKAARGTASAAWTLAEALCFSECPDRPADAQCWGALLAAQVLAENRSLEAVAERNRPKVERLRRWLVRVVADGLLSPVDRALAGRELARIGDPRDFDELVSIPAGPFWMGSDKAQYGGAGDMELPQHEVDLSAFKISKYPLTVGQWRRFVRETKYEDDHAEQQGPNNHPVVSVSWHDAQAYCSWLTGEWRKTGKIGQDETVRLPSESEWEKAARGDDRRIWPWGNEFEPDRANTVESGIGGTTSVGCFPGGASPYGCLDMAGNVWEWTWPAQAKYHYGVNDRREKWSVREGACVLRGASWRDGQRNARCASRNFDTPDLHLDFIGFRVAVSPVSCR